MVLLLIAIAAAAVVTSVYFTVGKKHPDSAQRYVRMGAGSQKGERLKQTRV